MIDKSLGLNVIENVREDLKQSQYKGELECTKNDFDITLIICDVSFYTKQLDLLSVVRGSADFQISI
jgi:hypothetical protein